MIVESLISSKMEIFTLTTIILVGLFSGFINVIVGSGSSITIPILIFLGLPPHLAIGTNRFAMLFNNFTGAAVYHVKKYLQLKTALIIGVFAAIGALFGANYVLGVDPMILKMIIAFILLVEAVVILVFRNKIGVESKQVPLKKGQYLVAAIFGLFIGLYGGFVGMAMTSVTMFFIMVVFKQTIIKSAAIAKVVTFLISLSATFIFIANLKVDFLVGIFLSVSYIIGGYVGAHSAIKMGDVRIKILFIIVVVASAIKLAFF